MPIKNATAEQIASLKEKLAARQRDRHYESQMDEVVAMVGKKRRPFPVKSRSARNDVAKALSFTALSFLGAVLWNSGITVGIILFAASAAAAVPHYKAIK